MAPVNHGHFSGEEAGILLFQSSENDNPPVDYSPAAMTGNRTAQADSMPQT